MFLLPTSWALSSFGRKFVTWNHVNLMIFSLTMCHQQSLHLWKVGLEYLNMHQKKLWELWLGDKVALVKSILILVTQSTGQKEREKNMGSRNMQLTQLVLLIITLMQSVSVNFWAQHNALLAHESYKMLYCF